MEESEANNYTHAESFRLNNGDKKRNFCGSRASELIPHYIVLIGRTHNWIKSARHGIRVSFYAIQLGGKSGGKKFQVTIQVYNEFLLLLLHPDYCLPVSLWLLFFIWAKKLDNIHLCDKLKMKHWQLIMKSEEDGKMTHSSPHKVDLQCHLFLKKCAKIVDGERWWC